VFPRQEITLSVKNFSWGSIEEGNVKINKGNKENEGVIVSRVVQKGKDAAL